MQIFPHKYRGSGSISADAVENGDGGVLCHRQMTKFSGSYLLQVVYSATVGSLSFCKNLLFYYWVSIN